MRRVFFVASGFRSGLVIINVFIWMSAFNPAETAGLINDNSMVFGVGLDVW